MGGTAQDGGGGETRERRRERIYEKKQEWELSFGSLFIFLERLRIEN